jgi:hypothetical protein
MQTLSPSRRQRASALLAVLALTTIALIVLGGIMRWTANNGLLIERNVAYHDTLLAAEAATEKVVANLAMDFARFGPAATTAKLPIYRTGVPTSDETERWSGYRFSNGLGTEGEVGVELTAPWAVSPLISQYQGLSGYASTYRLRADAEDLTARHLLKAGVQQDVQLALIPVFQFAIFYNLDLEINPGATMNVTGRTHGNHNIYLQPAAPLTFQGDITSAMEILPTKKPGDPVLRTPSTITYKAEHDSGVTSLNLPIGTANTPEAVRQIVEIPPASESVTSDLGRQRFYNLADVVVLVRDGDLAEARSSAASGGLGLPWASVSNWIRTDVSFFDQREQKTIKATQVDVSKFAAWNASTTNIVKTALGRDVNSLYVADLRTQTASTEAGVRLVNGALLPPLGLTVATQNPLYVKGHYNATGASVGTSNTANTKPASLIADSINVLSGNWNDTNSTKSISSRIATSTTVNAAFLAGIVETVPGKYSGGVENFPRFLENWSGKTFTYNGSMIVLYPSKHATAYWPGTGSVYNPPNRNWSFDLNFLDPDKLPPLCPSVRAVIRGQWAAVAAAD